MQRFAAVGGDLILKLEKIVGEDDVLVDENLKAPYSHDEIPGLCFMPDVVVRAHSTDQVSQVLKHAFASGVPVTPRGLGTGLSGGALAVHGGIVLSLEKMNRILEVDEENLMAVVEPGVVLGQFQKQVESLGLFYPPDPASLDSCSIGGNLAENAGGPRAFRYGVTSDYVRGVEVALPSGEVVSYGGKVVKNASGYDLCRLFVGSEGTLGVFTKAVLRLLPLPALQIDILVPFGDFEDATRTVTAILRQKRIVPALLEFMDGDSFRIANEVLGKTPPFPDAEAFLIVGLDGNDEADVLKQCDDVGSLCLDEGAQDVLVASSPAQKDRLWEPRRKLLEALKATSERVELEDIVVPRTAIPEFIRTTRAISARTGLPVANWGHAGDGNIHVAILKKDVDDGKWRASLEDAVDSVMDAAVALGGVITGEHGVGYLKSRFLPKVCGPVEISLMKTLKRGVDPLGLLNPGKMFP